MKPPAPSFILLSFVGDTLGTVDFCAECIPLCRKFAFSISINLLATREVLGTRYLLLWESPLVTLNYGFP